MHYYFNDDITIETVNNLVDKLQAVDKEEKIELYFSTSGGCSSSMEFLVNYFNSIKDRLTIVLISRCWSAGTDLLVSFEGKLVINHNEMDSFVFHLKDREMHLQSKDRDLQDMKIIRKQDKEDNLNFAKKIKNKNLLTSKQLKDFIKGKDIIVYREQFKKWKL